MFPGGGSVDALGAGEALEIVGPPRRVDHLPVITQCMKDLAIAASVDRLVPEHVQRELSTGACVEAMIVAILSGTHTLYRVAQTLEPWAISTLLGAPFTSERLSDNRLGRALDALFKIGVSKVNATVLLRALEVYELDTSLLHFDTSSISVYGRYTNSAQGDPEDPDGAPHLTYGHSKDYRPDLKQIVYGLSVSHDGYVPLLGRVTDGNRADALESRFNLTQLVEILPDPTSTTLVGDSKLFAGRTFQLAEQHNVRLLTLLPRGTIAWADAYRSVGDVKSAATLREIAVHRGTAVDEEGVEFDLRDRPSSTEMHVWRGRSVEVVHRWKDRTPDANVMRELPLHALVIWSSQLAERKAKTLERRRQKEQETLERLQRKLATREFNCEEDARTATAEVTAALGRVRVAAERAVGVDAHESDEGQPEPDGDARDAGNDAGGAPRSTAASLHTLEFRVISAQRPCKRARPGRPRKEEAAPATQTIYRLEFSFALDSVELERRLHRESCFILVTQPGARHDDATLLEAYKGQSGIEQAMRWTKGPAEVAPIFIETPQRIAALGLVYVLALMVHALVQRRLRQRLQEESTTIPGNRGRTARPTGAVLFRLLENINAVPVRTARGDLKTLIPDITHDQADVLRLMGVDLLNRADVIAHPHDPRPGQRGYYPGRPFGGPPKPGPRGPRRYKPRPGPVDTEEH